MDVQEAFHSELDAGQQSALISWLALAATFGTVRGITYSIKDGKGTFGVGAIALAGSYFAALPLLRKLGKR